MIPVSKKLITVVCLTSALMLGGCETAPSGNVPAEQAPLAQIQSMIEQARHLPSPQAETLLIKAGNQLLDQNKLREAGQVLNSFSSASLPAPLVAEHVMALARLAMAQGDNAKAVDLLTTDSMGLLTASNSLDADHLNRISLLRAQAWEAQGNYLSAARERIFVAPMLADPTQHEANHKQIWTDLINVPADTLHQLSQTAATPEIQGWLKLAWIYKGEQDNLDQQLKELKQWQQDFKDHPAAKALPESLRMLTELSGNKPQHIALLLPLEGKYRQSALAVQNGFMTAQYVAASAPDSEGTPTIKVYDTTNASDFSATYQQAVNDGADIIIGPLQKENVHQLATSTQNLPVLTIALNTDDSSTEPPSNLYQFGLSPEDDAREVADQAKRDNFTRAGVLYQTSAWSERASSAFTQSWNTTPENSIVTSTFDNRQDMAPAVKRLLLVDQSEARAAQLERVLGMDVKFQARRRQDLDFIYLIANPEQARLIKPLLNFYFAESLPVLAGSYVYSGENAPDKDRDLDGVEFCDIPWLLDPPGKMKTALLTAWPKANPRFLRLNALGIDAYRLQTHIRLLANVQGSGLFGATGVLSVGPNNRIQRGLTWARMVDGSAQKLPKIVDTSVMEHNEGNSSGTNPTQTQGQPGGTTGTPAPGTAGA